MRRASIHKLIISTSVALGLGAMTLLGGVAHADTFQQRMQAELNRGTDYAAAWAAASCATGPLYAPDLAADAKTARASLNQGKDYAAAWGAASRRTEPVFSPQQIARAQKVNEKLSEGKDYTAAREATTDAQPAARVQAASAGGLGVAPLQAGRMPTRAQ